MTPEEAGSLTTHGWYLIASNGDVAARIHPGMHLGEDASGELSFKPSDALLELDIEDENVLLSVASDKHEFEVEGQHRMRSVKVRPQTRTHIRLFHNAFSIDTNFALNQGSVDTVHIDVVQIPVLKLAVGRIRTALGPQSARPHLPGTIRAQTVDPHLSELDDGSESDHQQEAFDTGALLLEALPEPGVVEPVEHLYPLEQDKPRAYSLARPISAVSRMQTLPASSAAVFGVVAAVTFGVIYIAFQLLEGRSETPPGSEPVLPAPASSNLLPASRQAANVELLATVSALLESDQLPDRATIDLALQSLKSLRAIYPDDNAVRDSLEQLTVRLASEARLSYDRGDAIMAGRLIEQASTTGVAQDDVQSTAAYFETVASAPRLADTTVLDDTRMTEVAPAVTPAEEPDLQMEAPQLADIDLAPVIRVAPGIDPQVEVLSRTVEDDIEGRAESVQDIRLNGESSMAREDSLVQPIPVPVIEPVVLIVTKQPGVATDTFDEDVAIQTQRQSSSTGSPTASRPATDVDVTTGVDVTSGANEPPPSPADVINQATEMAGRSSLNASPVEKVLAEDRPVFEDAIAAGADEPSEVAGKPPVAGVSDERLMSLYPFAELVAIRVEPPEYPRRALSGAEGSVDLEFTVTRSGAVQDVEVLGDPPAYFARAAVQAVTNWKFKPVQENGEPTTVRTLIRVTFRG